MFSDSHCHLTCDRLYDHVDTILGSMERVSSCMIMCTNKEELERALALKAEDPRFKVAFGYFPGDAKEVDETMLAYLQTMLQEKKIDVLGEIGLDYYWDDSFKDRQKELFIQQIKMANEAHVPIAIHMREATQDCLDILKEYAKTKIIFHCFSGSVETMKECLKLDSFISFAGPITFKDAKHGPACVKACPLDRMLSETDSPYLTPVPFRGKENQPQYVEFVEQKISDLKEIPLPVVCEQIEKNFLSLFD